MAKVLCMNNGYRSIKSIKGEIFRSLYKENTHSSSNIDTIVYEGKRYVIGVGSAIKQADKTCDIGTKLLILNMICKVAPNESDILLMLTAPPLYHKQQKVALPKFLKGTHEFTWNGKYKKINILDVNVLPETILGFYPNNINGKYNKSKLLIFDVGGYTTNVCKIDCGNFTDDDYLTIEQHGMYNLDLQISQYLNCEYIQEGLHTNGEDIDHYRQHGLILDGKDIMIQEIENIQVLNDRFLDVIIDRCIDKSWDLSATQKLVIGGGGKLLYDTFDSKLSNVVLGNNPIFDTLNGLVLFAINVFGKNDVLT